MATVIWAGGFLRTLWLSHVGPAICTIALFVAVSWATDRVWYWISWCCSAGEENDRATVVNAASATAAAAADDLGEYIGFRFVGAMCVYEWDRRDRGDNARRRLAANEDEIAATTVNNNYGSMDGGEEDQRDNRTASEMEEGTRPRTDHCRGARVVIDDEEGPSCSICLDEYEPRDVVARLLPCGHVFHASCIGAWTRDHRRCPLCNLDLEKWCAAAMDAASTTRMERGN